MNWVSTIRTMLLLGGLFGFLTFSYGSPEDANFTSPIPSQDVPESKVEQPIVWYEYNALAHVWRSTRPNIFLVNKYGPTRVIRCGPIGDKYPQTVPAGGVAVCAEYWGKPTTLSDWGRPPLSGVDIYACTSALECTKYFSYP